MYISNMLLPLQVKRFAELTRAIGGNENFSDNDGNDSVRSCCSSAE